jgi:hypothetical protein
VTGNWRTSSHSMNAGDCVEIGAWRKSSRSGYNGDCIEVGAWRKSSHSGTGNCVEVGDGQAVVGVRDSKMEQSPVLAFPGAAWKAFTATLKAA